MPASIGNLTRLGVLSLRRNRITHLPPEMGQLRELHVLDVSGNKLQNLPFSITALNLKALWLAENQSQPMPKFQKDIDENTGEKVLTCFLLPQQLVDYRESLGEYGITCSFLVHRSSVKRHLFNAANKLLTLRFILPPNLLPTTNLCSVEQTQALAVLLCFRRP